MYLEKLVIQGFKSFAGKNELIFPGMLKDDQRGITAIVGPNGSGKSNIADAIRWALGEQSMKTLRGKKSEDVIFSGSDKKGKLSMAEVSLYLNNEDKKAPIEYSQIVITRRLYRNGDSEYLINNNRVRLSDIQILLAKANFGQKTYSVIGQGVVEGFLNTTLAERKEFFDEATGVKQFQIKRDDALNKLKNSYENLAQAQMLLAEIEPRIKSLTRQVNKLRKRDEIKQELRELQIVYYAKIWQEINAKFVQYNEEFLNKEKIKMEKERRIETLNRELNKLESENKISEEFNEWQNELNNWQNKKNNLNKELAKLEAQMEIKLEAGGNFDLSFLNNRKSELEKNISLLQEEITQTQEKIKQQKENLEEHKQIVKQISEELKRLNEKILNLNEVNSTTETEKINQRLKNILTKLEESVVLDDIQKIKEIIGSIKKELQNILSKVSSQEQQKRIKEVQEKIIKLTQKKEEEQYYLNKIQLELNTNQEKLKILNEQYQNSQEEKKQIESKLNQISLPDQTKNLESQIEQIKKQINEVNEKIANIRQKIDNFSRIEEEKRKHLFDLQRKIQEYQNEINSLNYKLNELKAQSTRYETKLEDLEIEIRRDLGGLKEIKNKKIEGHIELEPIEEKINYLKKQLELIGGIDPEVEDEYIKTKERFDFLSGQVNDLKEAINSLEKIIKELDVIIKKKFDKEFKIIARKFEEYFKILFNGGTAKIIKVLEEVKEDEEGNQEEKTMDINKIKFLQKHNATGLVGIEIQACPPGKKIKSISMLSGGERALTAIALICAIISANPSPFVVLDEVDAALDEANSERLARILDDLSHKTQFIAITHNRATMRRAHILYGVTMGDDGVSKLLSVKLEEAQKNAK